MDESHVLSEDIFLGIFFMFMAVFFVMCADKVIKRFVYVFCFPVNELCHGIECVSANSRSRKSMACLVQLSCGIEQFRILRSRCVRLKEKVRLKLLVTISSKTSVSIKYLIFNDVMVVV